MTLRGKPVRPRFMAGGRDRCEFTATSFALQGKSLDYWLFQPNADQLPEGRHCRWHIFHDELGGTRQQCNCRPSPRPRLGRECPARSKVDHLANGSPLSETRLPRTREAAFPSRLTHPERRPPTPVPCARRAVWRWPYIGPDGPERDGPVPRPCSLVPGEPVSSDRWNSTWPFPRVYAYARTGGREPTRRPPPASLVIQLEQALLQLRPVHRHGRTVPLGPAL